MRTITETFAAGETKQFGIPGERFELINSVGPVSVSLQDANGIELTNGLSQNIAAGSYMQEGKFSRIAITSATAQTLTFVIANGDSGTRSIAGTVQVAGTVKTQDTGLPYTNSYSGVGPVCTVAGTPVQIVAPAANVNGITVHFSLNSHVDAPTNGLAALIAKSSAPVSVTDGDVLNYAGSGSGSTVIQLPIFVPAGKGLYWIANVAETGGLKAVLYSIL
jgi:hypothetical protein